VGRQPPGESIAVLAGGGGGTIFRVGSRNRGRKGCGLFKKGGGTSSPRLTKGEKIEISMMSMKERK